MATILMLDGFEHGDASTTTAIRVPDAITGAPSIVTTPVRTGARALKINPTSTQQQWSYTTASTTVVMSFYVRFATLPTADIQLAHVVSTVNMYLWFLNTNDKFGVSVTTSGAVEGGPTIVVDTWYRIDLEFDTTTNTFSVKCQVDGGTEFSDTGASTSANITAARLGNTSAETFEAFYDDLLISVTAGDYPIGAHSIEGLIPSSDGTHNITTSGDFDSFTGTAFSNSTTNGNTFIGHRPIQVANTADQVIRQELGTTANYMEFGMENLSDNTLPVLAARAYACHVESAASGASLGEARLLLSDNTEVLTTGSISVINSTEDPGTTVTLRKRMTIAPSGGWDGAKVDGLKARVGFADNAPDVNFIDFMVEVALGVAAAPGTALQPVVIVVGL